MARIVRVLNTPSPARPSRRRVDWDEVTAYANSGWRPVPVCVGVVLTAVNFAVDGPDLVYVPVLAYFVVVVWLLAPRWGARRRSGLHRPQPRR